MAELKKRQTNSLGREILVWAIAYSLISSTYFFRDYITEQIHNIATGVLMLGLSILWPVYLSSELLGIPIYLLGVLASFTTLLFAYHRLELRGWKLVRLYALPHPFIVSLFQASRAFFYHATDTPGVFWLMYGVIAYLWLIAVAYAVSRTLRWVNIRV